jgi:hypothetical protein
MNPRELGYYCPTCYHEGIIGDALPLSYFELYVVSNRITLWFYCENCHNKAARGITLSGFRVHEQEDIIRQVKLMMSEGDYNPHVAFGKIVGWGKPKYAEFVEYGEKPVKPRRKRSWPFT